MCWEKTLIYASPRTNANAAHAVTMSDLPMSTIVDVCVSILSNGNAKNYKDYP